jgi:hypothetical protein
MDPYQMQSLGSAGHYGAPVDYNSQLISAHYSGIYQPGMHTGQAFGGMVSSVNHSTQSQQVLEAFNRNLRQYNHGSTTPDYYQQAAQQPVASYGYPQTGYAGQQMYYQDAYGNPIAYQGYPAHPYRPQGFENPLGHDSTLQGTGDSDRIGNFMNPNMQAGTPILGSTPHSAIKHPHDPSRG